MRILVSNTPLIYRESFALAIHQHNPIFEVMIADPASVDGKAERFGPHALIRDDDGTEIVSSEGLVYWVGIIKDDRLKARISVDGRVSEVHEVSLARCWPSSTGPRNSSLLGRHPLRAGGGLGYPESPSWVTSSMVIHSLSKASLAASCLEETPIFG